MTWWRRPAGAPQQGDNHHAVHDAALDGWRGVAILLLLVGHFVPVPGMKLGTLGVNFFFVLSGLLMTRLLFVSETGLARFYWRRMSRILPAHLTFIGVVVLAWTVDGRGISARETWSALLFVNNYIGPPAGQAAMPFGHVWSLAVEEHSYIVLSLLALAARRLHLAPERGLAVLAVTSATCAIALNILRFDDPRLPFTAWLHTEVAAFGILASGWVCLALRRRTGWRGCPAAAVPALIVLGCATYWWSVPPAIQTVAGTGMLAVAVNLLPHGPRWVQQLLGWAPLRWLGTCSFSLYLWQQPFYLWTRNDGGPLGLALAGAVLAGLLSYYLVERPARRWLNRRAPA